MGTQQFCLRWNNHQTNLLAVFDQLLQNEAFVDVTLACEGLSIKAHKMVLSACSPYFQSLFVDNPCQHPIVILKDVRFSELKAVVDFMYKGEVNVSQDQLSALLKTAETLKVKGLAEVTGGSDPSGSASDGVTRSTLGPSLSSQGGPPSQRSDGSLSPAPKRKRGRPSKRPSQDGDLEVVESLVDVVPDGPDSVPSNQDRSMDSTQNVKDLLSEPPQSMADQTLNTTTDMAYDGIPQDHTSNSRDSGMMMADQQQSSSSSSLGQLPATASTSGMSPGQVYMDQPQQSPEVIPLVKDEPYETMQLSPCTLSVPASMPTVPPPQPPPPQPVQNMPVQANLQPTMSAVIPSTSSQAIAAAVASTSQSAIPPQVPAIPGTSSGAAPSEVLLLRSGRGGFPCPVCSKMFHNRNARTNHMGLHKGLYACPVCHIQCETKYKLRRHLKTHAKRKPPQAHYECPACLQKFFRRFTLEHHMVTHFINSDTRLTDEDNDDSKGDT